MGRPKSTTPESEQYRAKRDAEGARSRVKAAAGKEIGSVPNIKNVRRRTRCRASLRLFCETYNPAAFSLAWSPDHLREMARIEEAIHHGALYAFAEPRGNGKTTRVRMATLYAISYSLCRYVFVIGATATKAEDNLAAVKSYARFLPLYAEDFPEVAHPVRALAGIANRAAGQTCNGEPTQIEWGKDRIFLPTVLPPANWPKSWPLRGDGYVLTSGSIVGVAGLTGDGIRGSLITLSTGEALRPDLVLLDDPQTHESATSLTQNATRLQLVSADVLGMAGPGKAISAVMPCTVIARGDAMDQVLDRQKHPLWRGERTKMLTSMPADLAAWDGYFEVYRSCALLEPPDFDAANALYLARQAELEAGAVASWPERKLPWEVSAIQHAMHLYYRDPIAFMAEYQNDPAELVGVSDVRELVADEVASRLDLLPRGCVQRGATRVTAGIDLQGTCLFWLVIAWGEDFGGRVVDYGCYPRQNRGYFSAREADPTLESQFPGVAESGRIYAGLKALAGELLGRSFPRDGGGEPGHVERCLIDAQWGEHTDTVYQFCRQSPHVAVLLPSHGKGIAASSNPMSSWIKKPDERRSKSGDWVMPGAAGGRGRHVTYDTNLWKSFLADRLQSAEGSRGCLWLPGDKPYAHRLLADHFCCERREKTEGRGRELHEWGKRPGLTENHWFDCATMCCVGASIQGLIWSAASAAGETPAPAVALAPRRKFSDIQREKQERREKAGK